MKTQNHNSITITGNLGNQPEIKELTSGLLCAKFNLATQSFSKDEKGEWKKQIKWHKIVAWGATAEYAKSVLSKGLCANIEGQNNQRNYTDKHGNTHCYTEIVAKKIMVLHKKEKNVKSQQLALA